MLEMDPYIYEEMMYDKGISQRKSIGDTTVTVLDEPNAYELYYNLITKDPNYFLDQNQNLLLIKLLR